MDKTSDPCTGIISSPTVASLSLSGCRLTMSSPAPGEVMGITSMLNQKGAVSAVQPAPGQMLEQPMTQQLPPLPLERADSPHGSEHSRYSQPPMNQLQNGRPYGSPSAMHAPLHMPEPNMAPTGMAFPQMTPDMSYGAPQPTRPEAAQQAPKAYPCSTCGKGFARRSDLARHGWFPMSVVVVVVR